MNATTTPSMALAVGQFVEVDSEEVEIVAINGRWVKLANGQSIGRAAALESRCEESDDEPAPTIEAAFIEHVAAELDTTPADANITLTPTGYVGPMLALRERLAAGAYKKAPNGQPCCGDEIAIALGSLTPAQVIRACIVAMNLPNNPYTHLNIGQQSMNLRNKLRGCMKRGEFGMGVVVEAVEVVLEADQA